jgi:hypothetical protein
MTRERCASLWHRRAVIGGVFWLVSLVSACHGLPKPFDQTTASSSSLRARDYSALGVGNRFHYRATPGTSETHVLTIVSFDSGYFVDDRGGRLAPRTDGLFDGQRFLLQDPLVVGHEWVAKATDQGVERYRIEADDLTVTVPAGTFHHCVLVTGTQQVVDEKSGKPAQLHVTTTWAPGVGAVRIAFQIQVAAQEPVTTSVSELVAFVAAGAPSQAMP